MGHARYLVDGLAAARAAGVMGDVCTELETTEAELFQATVVPLLSKAAEDEQAPVCRRHCRRRCNASADVAGRCTQAGLAAVDLACAFVVEQGCVNRALWGQVTRILYVMGWL